jgi:hypothetical protein
MEDENPPESPWGTARDWKQCGLILIGLVLVIVLSFLDNPRHSEHRDISQPAPKKAPTTTIEASEPDRPLQ